MSTQLADKVFAGTESNPNVIPATKQYDSERMTGKHVRTNSEVVNPLSMSLATRPSELDFAKAGAMFKMLASKSGVANVSLSEHETELFDAVTRDDWAGLIGSDYHEKISAPARIKTLIANSGSGGIELTPHWFDDAIVTYPLLTGEILPKVDLREVPRGQFISGAAVGNPTIQWGVVDDSTVSLFDTSNLVSGLDSTVYGAACAVLVGRDFLSDAAVDVGRVLTQNIGQRFAEELDDVCMNGNGTTQPEGILTASGFSTVTPDNTTTGPPTVDDFVTLLFSIGKQYRNRAYAPTFISNDTSFQRSRSIAIDTNSPTTDQRPALAPLQDVNKYETLGWPHAIQNDVPNGTCVFGGLRKYRLYRRKGMQIRFVDGGDTLARANSVLLIARARYAGRVMDANAFAKWTTGQS
jgi:HK97 family phage major capsid protein